MPDKHNLYDELPLRSDGELFTLLAENSNVRIERIVSMGHRSPEDYWYDQDENEWVVVLRGNARIRFEYLDETLELGPGEHVLIPAHQKHRVDWTTEDEPTVWLAVFYK